MHVGHFPARPAARPPPLLTTRANPVSACGLTHPPCERQESSHYSTNSQRKSSKIMFHFHLFLLYLCINHYALSLLISNTVLAFLAAAVLSRWVLGQVVERTCGQLSTYSYTTLVAVKHFRAFTTYGLRLNSVGFLVHICK